MLMAKVPLIFYVDGRPRASGIRTHFGARGEAGQHEAEQGWAFSLRCLSWHLGYSSGLGCRQTPPYNHLHISVVRATAHRHEATIF